MVWDPCESKIIRIDYGLEKEYDEINSEKKKKEKIFVENILFFFLNFARVYCSATKQKVEFNEVKRDIRCNNIVTKNVEVTTMAVAYRACLTNH